MTLEHILSKMETLYGIELTGFDSCVIMIDADPFGIVKVCLEERR